MSYANFQDEEMDDMNLSMSSDSEEKPNSPEYPERTSEVFSFGNNEDDSDENEDEISKDDYFDIPDTRAWGKKKKTYYYSDYVDSDLATLTEKDEKNADIEEEEAKSIQKRLAQELDDVDFGLNVTLAKQIETEANTKHTIKIDMSKFTEKQKLELLEKESPEFMILTKDIKAQLHEIKTTLDPYLKLMKRGNYSNNTAFTFVQTKYHVILNYCINILFYMTLKSKQSLVNLHPVIKRLAQYRQLLNQLNSVQKNVLYNLEKLHESPSEKSRIERGNTDKVMSNQILEQKMNLNQSTNQKFLEEENYMEEMPVDRAVGNENNQIERREITYQISKNKGLTPHRSKEQRNPRVKHRNKYRKALIRRKGAVREARKEIKRYGGEATGIKIGLKKSVSIK